MFGEKLLVAPIIYKDETEREVYLPSSTEWIDIFDQKEYKGGQIVKVDAPLDKIPVFVRKEFKNDFKDLLNFVADN